MSEATAPATAEKSATNGKPKAKKSGKTAGKANPKTTARVSPSSFLKLGAAETKNVAMKSLTFDRRLQHRAKLTDETAVEEYMEIDKESAKAGKPTPFLPAKAVHQSVDEEGNACDVYWVYDGFQRGEAWRYNKRAEVPVEVIEGTFADAFFLSLSSNSTNSVLPRDRGDKRRSVLALLDSPEARELAFAKAKSFGGVMKAMAAACGVSVGTVDNALADRGLRVSGDKLVRRPARPEPKSETDSGSTGENSETPIDPAEKKKTDEAAFAVMRQRAYDDRVTEASKLVRRLAALVATLVTDSVHAPAVRKLMAQSKLSLDGEFDARAKSQGEEFSPYYETLEHWPVASKLGTFFAEAKRIGEAAKEAAAEAAPGTEAPEK